MRLDMDAKPSPQGKLSKVCQTCLGDNSPVKFPSKCKLLFLLFFFKKKIHIDLSIFFFS